MAFADMSDKSIPTTFQQNVASADPRYVKAFQNYDVSNPHPGFGKDPNILNEFGHTKYPKFVKPSNGSDPVIVNNEDEENEALGKTVELKDNGPTIEEYVAAGYKADTYPPKGYASKSSDKDIEAAIKRQNTSW